MDYSREIVERLDILIALSIPPFSEGKYSIGQDVLPYCDGMHTVSDIVTKSKKTKKAVEMTLERLRGKGIIRSIIKDSKTYYIRLT